MHSPQRAPRFFLIPLTCAVCLLASFARAEDSSSLITQAQEQLQTEHFAEALTLAQEAVRRTPDDYRGHYYVAMACMVLGRFDEAETAVARAQTLAPENAQDAVKKLRTTIASSRQGEDNATAANAAFTDGLLAKAARLYREAWNAQHAKPELALKAAELYANRLGEPVTAATLWREVIAAHQGTQPAEKAQVQLDRVDPIVKQIALQKFQASKVTQVWEDEIRLLAEAQAADPTNGEIYLWRAERTSRSLDPDYFKAALKDLARVGLATDENLLNIEKLAVWLDKPGFSDFLADVIGAGTVARLKTAFAQKIAAIKVEQARRLVAIEQERVAVEARHQAEMGRLDQMERQLEAKFAAIDRKVGEIKALRQLHWDDFIKLLRGTIIEDEFKVWYSGRGIKNRFVHFYNQVTIGQNSVTLKTSSGGGHPNSVVAAPGRFKVNELFENSFGIVQLSVFLDSWAAIEEIGEPASPERPSEQSGANIFFNGRKYNFTNTRARVAALVAQQKKIEMLHQEISSLFEPIPKLQQVLKAAGRNVRSGPVYAPSGN